MKEIWKDVKGYEGLYQVSSFGNIKSNYRGGRILKNAIGGSGYLIITLCRDRKRENKNVHQLVAIAFLGHNPNVSKFITDHINHNPLDNRVENLQIISHRENISRAQFKYNRTSKYIGVSWNKQCKKWISKIEISGKEKYLGCFLDEIEASIYYQNELKNIKT